MTNYSNEVVNRQLGSADVAYWCPCCHAGALIAGVKTLNCSACSTVYPVVDNVPILINDNNSVFAISDYLSSDSYGGASYGSESEKSSGIRFLYRRFAHAISETGIKRSHLGAEDAIAKLCSESTQRPKILVISA